MRLSFLVVPVLAGALLVSACGGGGDEGDAGAGTDAGTSGPAFGTNVSGEFVGLGL
jgi:hypothetical protein